MFSHLIDMAMQMEPYTFHFQLQEPMLVKVESDVVKDGKKKQKDDKAPPLAAAAAAGGGGGNLSEPQTVRGGTFYVPGIQNPWTVYYAVDKTSLQMHVGLWLGEVYPSISTEHGYNLPKVACDAVLILHHPVTVIESIEIFRRMEIVAGGGMPIYASLVCLMNPF